MIKIFIRRKNFVFLFLGIGIYFFLSLSCKKIPFAPKLNKKPNACFIATNIEHSLRVDFDANSSYDDDGSIIKYDWDFGDGTIGEGVEPYHNYQEPGIYYVKLTVTDDDYETDTDIDEIDVFITNVPPRAVLSINAETATVDFIWEFDGSLSYDVDGYITKYTFQIIRISDDKEILKPTGGPQHRLEYLFKAEDLRNKESQTFLIILNVKDNKDYIDEDKKKITVLKSDI